MEGRAIFGLLQSRVGLPTIAVYNKTSLRGAAVVADRVSYLGVRRRLGVTCATSVTANDFSTLRSGMGCGARSGYDYTCTADNVCIDVGASTINFGDVESTRGYLYIGDSSTDVSMKVSGDGTELSGNDETEIFQVNEGSTLELMGPITFRDGYGYVSHPRRAFVS